MTSNESTALRTNGEPQRILLEASERIKACYPNGTRVEALIDGKRVTGTLRYAGLGLFVIFIDGDASLYENFYPDVHPHRVLP